MSRYYDPEMGRFINADKPSLSSMILVDITGKNLFLYCLNSPVNTTDSDGDFVVSGLVMGIAAGAAVGGLLAALTTYNELKESDQLQNEDYSQKMLASIATGALLGGGASAIIVNGGAILGAAISSLTTKIITDTVSCLFGWRKGVKIGSWVDYLSNFVCGGISGLDFVASTAVSNIIKPIVGEASNAFIYNDDIDGEKVILDSSVNVVLDAVKATREEKILVKSLMKIYRKGLQNQANPEIPKEFKRKNIII